MHECRRKNASLNIVYPSTLIGQPIYPSSNGKLALAKTRFDLIPFAAVGEIADVLAYGAEKYEANNWARGTNWGRYFAALCRHLFAWWGGEDKDPETGFSHLAHAGCCLIFLMEYQRNNWGTDDRFTGPDGSTFTKDDGIDTQVCDPTGCHTVKLSRRELYGDDDGYCDI